MKICVYCGSVSSSNRCPSCGASSGTTSFEESTKLGKIHIPEPLHKPINRCFEGMVLLLIMGTMVFLPYYTTVFYINIVHSLELPFETTLV